jgi:hypothetical protein
LRPVARELTEYELDVVGVQRVGWNKGDTLPVEGCTFFCGNGNKNHQLGSGYFLHKRVILADKKMKFISGKTSYTV